MYVLNAETSPDVWAFTTRCLTSFITTDKVISKGFNENKFLTVCTKGI